MISLFSHLSDQPCSMKRAARSSSSSGCVGLSPCVPKSLAVATNPFPKCQPHTRLTITRAARARVSVKRRSASSSRPEPFLNVVSSLRRAPPGTRGARSPLAPRRCRPSAPACSRTSPGLVGNQGVASDQTRPRTAPPRTPRSCKGRSTGEPGLGGLRSCRSGSRNVGPGGCGSRWWCRCAARRIPVLIEALNELRILCKIGWRPALSGLPSPLSTSPPSRRRR